ncbi:hypothetical protein D2V17_09900 [Aurantiacibacter xanthus]|uniref:DUF2029 domain-containing protein n=1 Tax=Aurantiacibacter xanthus TaxID=1784712 RepID=A0A3A1P3R7_9SPHN|nr:hypothetical protein [Aurantiacibacter xanthus]RIV86129.1 hypothetical protein D2V17_09900 [Aurantiacibacter xanthus]
MRGAAIWLTRWCALERPLRHLPRLGALAVLLALVGALAWSTQAVPQMTTGANQAQVAKAQKNGKKGIGDYELYRRIHKRVDAGEGYYAAAIAEQRANRYPVKPFVTVRLPTLAYLQSLFGLTTLGHILVGMLVVSIGLYLPLTQDRTGLAERVAGAVALLLGGASLFVKQGPLSHESVAGILLTLALLSYRTTNYWPTLILAAMALAVRELALPFVLLWLVLALVARRWREAGWVAGLVGLFALGLWLHSLGVAAAVTEGGLASPGWKALAGPALPLMGMVRMTPLLMLPTWLAAPLAVLPLVGWASLGGKRAGFACLAFVGFFTMMALFARVENYYWILIVLPAYAAGLAFAPRAVADLVAAARGKVASGN